MQLNKSGIVQNALYDYCLDADTPHPIDIDNRLYETLHGNINVFNVSFRLRGNILCELQGYLRGGGGNPV